MTPGGGWCDEKRNDIDMPHMIASLQILLSAKLN